MVAPSFTHVGLLEMRILTGARAPQLPCDGPQINECRPIIGAPSSRLSKIDAGKDLPSINYAVDSSCLQRDIRQRTTQTERLCVALRHNKSCHGLLF